MTGAEMKAALIEIFGAAWRAGAVRWSGVNASTVSRQTAKAEVEPLWAAAVTDRLQLERYRRMHNRSQKARRVALRAGEQGEQDMTISRAIIFALALVWVASVVVAIRTPSHERCPIVNSDPVCAHAQ